MALYWGFVVALLALNLGFSEVQSTESLSSTMTTTIVTATSTTSTGTVAPVKTTAPVAPVSSVSSVASVASVASVSSVSSVSSVASVASVASVTTTTQIAATTTQTVATTTRTVAPITPTSSPSSFYTYLIAGFKISDSECPEEKDASLKSEFESFYDNPMFDLKTITFKVIRDECLFNVTFTFGPNLKLYNISEVFDDELKRINNTVDKMVLTNIITYVNAPGVLGDFKVAAGACMKICCDGAGGPITLNRTCLLTGSPKCKIYKLQKVELDCMDVCSKECSGVTLPKISLLVLLLGVFMNWFLK